MIPTLRLSELQDLSGPERDAKIREFCSQRPEPGEALVYLDERIAKFETRYEMSSATMRLRMSSGEMRETADICSWLMLAKMRERIIKIG